MFKLSSESEGKLLPASKESWLAHDFFPSILNGHKRVIGVLLNAKLRLWICFLFVYDVFWVFCFVHRRDGSFKHVHWCEICRSPWMWSCGLVIHRTVVHDWTLTYCCYSSWATNRTVFFIATNTCLPPSPLAKLIPQKSSSFISWSLSINFLFFCCCLTHYLPSTGVWIRWFIAGQCY